MSSKPKIKFHKVTHCIFDLDGTLLDTETIYEDIVRQIAAKFNTEYTLEVRFKIMGTTERRGAEIAIGDLKLPVTIDQFLEIYHKMAQDMLGNSNMMKGAERLLCHLHCHGVPLALATSSSEKMVALKTFRWCNIFKLFHHHVCASSDPAVKKGKPAPDIFLLAAARFPDKPDEEKCLVFEDAPNGVQGAIAAGMQVVMVPDARATTEMKALATQVIDSLEDFKPEEFGLPPFPRDNCSR